MKALLWMSATMLVALAFPLQVYAGNPYPSLLPYLFALPMAVMPEFKRKGLTLPSTVRRNRALDAAVGLYAVFALSHTFLQYAFAGVSIAECAGAVATFVLPVSFYFYFSVRATEAEVRSVVWGIALAGLAVGFYSAYENISRLTLGEVNQYARDAHQYRLDRTGAFDVVDENLRRINALTGGFGLLETHTVSATWALFAGAAWLALLPRRLRAARILVFLALGVLTILGLNATSIVAFAAVALVSLFRDRASSRRHAASVGSEILLFTGVGLLMALAVSGGIATQLREVGESVLAILTNQTNLVRGANDDRIVYLLILWDVFVGYLRHLATNPLILLTGDGFTTYGFGKSGDFGWVETLARFGLPFFLLINLGLARLTWRALSHLTSRNKVAVTDTEAGLVALAASIVLVILVNELHYSVWPAKTVLPIVFFALALFGRQLPPQSSSLAPASFKLRTPTQLPRGVGSTDRDLPKASHSDSPARFVSRRRA